tara:strand:+ start:423 stop:551 length:129 start_codon:yes stop_codon:yes gene_type:complete
MLDLVLRFTLGILGMACLIALAILAFGVWGIAFFFMAVMFAG